MRKHNKQQCAELIQTMEEAHAEILRLIESNDMVNASELLEECQQAAIAIGGIIEESDGEGTEAVSRLEGYCEYVYGINESIKNGTEISTDKTEKAFLDWIEAVRAGINNLPVRTEVVFLPYKASMWDSLETVWKKADADPDCDAYVIPIPYYDRNPDGTMREEHYEGAEYPEYVPITDYREYDFENRHPDRIYIHNPYDNGNFVTTVHPFFYSKHLKDLTDELVYIPYFVLADPDPDNEASLEGIKPFIAVAGVVNAHKVIVQSEKMRLAYIKVMTEIMGDHTRQYWENKISGEGSPKFEKIENTKISDLNIPDEWEKLIQKPDGTRKKIILYNVGVKLLIVNGEKMLDKMYDVLRIFKENQENVTLLFRPHPLLKATVESMRPGLHDKYKALIEGYISEGWGIYDDTPDLDRAIILSDAYYGDPSSLVELYKRTKKPIMIQNPDVLEKNVR